MSVKLIAIYAQPADPAAFDRHYDEIHTPLVQKVPGLQSLNVNRVRRTLMGDAAPYMIAEMAFADREAFDAAMASPENRAAGKDLMGFANGIVTLVVADAATH